MAQTASQHYDAIKDELLRLEDVYGKKALKPLHRLLGKAWDDYNNAYGDEDTAARSGGGSKEEGDDGDETPGDGTP